MPPHRRRPAATPSQAPPIRRPKVAGLRNRPEQNVDQDNATHVLNGVRGRPPVTRPDVDDAEETTVLPRVTDEEAADTVGGPEDAPPAEVSAGGTPAPEPAGADPEVEVDPDPDPEVEVEVEDAEVDDAEATEVEEADPETSEPPAHTSRRPRPTAAVAKGGTRPAGKLRTTGTSRPTDLAAAETGTGTEPRRVRRAKAEGRPARTKSQTQISVAITLAVVAVVLAGLAVFFRGKADDLTSGDTNTALTDSAVTSQLKGQLTNAIKQTFSYNYTDLDATEKAVGENLTGKALCEYNLLFGEVKQYAPEQKIVLDTTVRELAIVRIDGDRAEALVYIDQLSTRVDLNKTVAVGGQFAVQAHREGDHWKITEFDMFGQPLFNGEPAPTC